MPEQHEWMFYEVMWRSKAHGATYPLLWWVQEYFQRWRDAFDGGLFDSKEAAFAANAQYRYWNMVGVKDRPEESLVGQAGEIEPVYQQYALSFFLFDNTDRRLCFPQAANAASPVPSLEQRLDDNYLPVVITTYHSPIGVDVEEKVLATVVGAREKSMVLVRLQARPAAASAHDIWLCAAVIPVAPSCFQRHDRAGHYGSDGRVSYIQYIANENRVEVNNRWGPVFTSVPAHFGVYGNPGSFDPNFYLDNSPYRDLAATGALNGQDDATDRVGGLCTAVFAWPINLAPPGSAFEIDIRLPVDDFRDQTDLNDLRSPDREALEQANRTFWTNKLDGSGLQASLPGQAAALFNLFKTCRANLLILADDGAIHPGPTIYDSFWVRDSSVEGIACALAGDANLAEAQFGRHYPDVFNLGYDRIGPASAHGFFGSYHEKDNQEWDSNGEALWAIGRFDRISGSQKRFGAALFEPYVIEGARWLRDNRSPFGLLYSGWAAEHIGDKDKPHFWDDFWAIAGVWEAAKLAERTGAPETGELWDVYGSLRQATADSIRWVLDQQRQRGFWKTFIPTGPADVGRLDSTMIGALAYFHPCRLYMGSKLGADIDYAARMTLETIWSHFVTGGFRHDAAWHSYGAYLTIQLAHCFLLIGDIDRMKQLLAWSVNNAAFARVSRDGGVPADQWEVVSGAWNEQHCYPIANDFSELPDWWYMGDIPHGWACAEFMLLLRDMLFFEADEDGQPHVYLAPGVPTEWLGDGDTVTLAGAPTIFGVPFGYTLTHHPQAQTIEIEITQALPANISYIYPCRFGTGVASVTVDGNPLQVTGRDIRLPPGMVHAVVRYAAG